MNTLRKRLLAYLIINRIFLLLLTFAIANFNGIGDRFDSFGNFLTKYGSRWDGNSYSFISEFGYVDSGMEKNYIVFPPVFPFITRPFGQLINNYPLAGMLLSNIFFILGCLVFFKLLRLDYSKKFSLYVIFLISIFPTTFFFSVAYPESLFFLIFGITFYLARIKNFRASFLFSTLAPLTRPFGIATYPSLLLIWLKNNKRKFVDIFILGFSFTAAVLVYLFINYKTYNDPLAFSKILQTNWQKSFVPPWESIISSWGRGIYTKEWSEYKFMIGYSEAITSTLAWVFTFASMFINKLKLKSEYFLYLLIGVFLFTSTGFILSSPRYLISLPPMFIIFAKITKSKYAKIIWIPVSIFALFYLSVKWAEGWWAY